MRVVQKDKDLLEKQHKRVQAQIETLPDEKKKQIKAIQKLVDHEIAENNALFFNDGMFAADAFLVRNGLLSSDRDDFKRAVDMADVGEVFIFRNKSFIKSYDGLIHSTQDYIRSLELTIVEQVQYKEVKYVSYLSELDKLGFVGLINLAFSRLFKRNKKQWVRKNNNIFNNQWVKWFLKLRWPKWDLPLKNMYKLQSKD